VNCKLVAYETASGVLKMIFISSFDDCLNFIWLCRAILFTYFNTIFVDCSGSEGAIYNKWLFPNFLLISYNILIESAELQFAYVFSEQLQTTVVQNLTCFINRRIESYLIVLDLWKRDKFTNILHCFSALLM
jgi:hypothetical protein